jgi:redox-sensitive bicupin YhaK (pirin superfamily)
MTSRRLEAGEAVPETSGSTAVGVVIQPREHDLGDGFMVRRMLPAAALRTVGPFVFFDHFGPSRFAPGKGLDVRPHPHINLATVTYLFEGEIIHRDSLGYHQAIQPGDINWMTAGRGIVHSERTDARLRATGSASHGLQLWLALPREHEETAPTFHHHPAATLPEVVQPGVEMRLLAGEAFGLRSPVQTFSRLVYLDLRLEPDAVVDLPTGDDDGDRAIYVVEGAVDCQGQSFSRFQMVSLRPRSAVQLRATAPSRLVMIGGDPFPEPRHLWWNFVSSSRERIEQAKHDWRERRGEAGGPFPLVPGDETEFIPLP